MIRLALIGCSEAAGYGRVAARLRGGRFTAVADRYAQTAASSALGLGAEVVSDSFDDLLAEHPTSFDAVVFQSPCYDQAPLCRRAAAEGKHLLLDSPESSFINAFEDVITACASSGVRLMVGQTFRFLPSLQAIKASLDRGQLGEPGLLRIHRWESPDLRTDPERLLTRDIDLACWLFGKAPTEVYAKARWVLRREPDDPDYIQLHLGFGGGMALIDHAQTLPPGEGYYSLSLIGSAGAAYADDHHNMQLLFGREHPVALRTRQGDGPLLAQLQEFVNSITEGREPSITGADGWRVLVVASAADLSIGRSQSLFRDGDSYTLVD